MGRIVVSTKATTNSFFIKAEDVTDRASLIQCWVLANSYVQSGGDTSSDKLLILKKFCKKLEVSFEQAREFITIIGWSTGSVAQMDWFKSEFKNIAPPPPPPPKPLERIIPDKQQIIAKIGSRKPGEFIRWTEDDDRRLIELVHTNDMSFEEIAKLFCRTKGSVSQRYYGLMRKPKKK